MTEPPRRKRFQFHLSTAIVMMFVAGALIWVNLREEYKSSERTKNGWPAPFWFEEFQQNFLAFIVFDIAVAIIILIAVWFLCEWLIRRRAARKGS